MTAPTVAQLEQRADQARAELRAAESALIAARAAFNAACAAVAAAKLRAARDAYAPPLFGEVQT